MEQNQTKALLPEKVADLSPVQRGWLKLAGDKITLFEELEAGKLAVQQMFLNVKTDMETDSLENLCNNTKGLSLSVLNKRLESVQAVIAKAKEIWAVDKEKRLAFTRRLEEKLINPSMEFEKESNIAIQMAVKNEFILRKAVTDLNKEAEKKNNEEASFKAHCENEHFRIAAQYRADLESFTLDAYAKALEQKQPVKQIEAYRASIKNFLADIALSKFIKYEFRKDDNGNPIIPKERAAEIFKSVKPYNSEDDLKAAQDKVDEVFINYAADLKKSEKVVKEVRKEIEEVKEKVEEEIETEAATNNLIAKAETFTMTGGPTIKENWKVQPEPETESESWQWALAVIAAFLKNIQKAQPFLKVKTRSKLTVQQMADALGKLHTSDNTIKFANLNMVKEEK